MVAILVVEVLAYVRGYGGKTRHVILRVVVGIGAVVVVGDLLGVSYVGDGRRGDVRRCRRVVFWCTLLDVEDLVFFFYVAVKEKRKIINLMNIMQVSRFFMFFVKIHCA